MLSDMVNGMLIDMVNDIPIGIGIEAVVIGVCVMIFIWNLLADWRKNV